MIIHPFFLDIKIRTAGHFIKAYRKNMGGADGVGPAQSGDLHRVTKNAKGTYHHLSYGNRFEYPKQEHESLY